MKYVTWTLFSQVWTRVWNGDSDSMNIFVDSLCEDMNEGRVLLLVLLVFSMAFDNDQLGIS